MLFRNAVVAGAIALALAGPSRAAVIAQFNFNSNPADTDTTTGTLTPNVGAGTVSLVGGTTSTFAPGSPSDTSTSTDNTGFNLTTFPAQGTASGTAGVQVAVSTLSQPSAGEQLQLSLDLRQSGSASRYFQLQLSSDGTTFTNASGGTASLVGTQSSSNTLTSFSNSGLYVNNAGGGSQNYVVGITYTLAAGSVYQNDPNFAFRFVSVFDQSGTAPGNYISSNAGTSAAYGTTGTARFDLVTVSSVATPEPTTLAFAGLCGAGLLARRRRA